MFTQSCSVLEPSFIGRNVFCLHASKPEQINAKITCVLDVDTNSSHRLKKPRAGSCTSLVTLNLLSSIGVSNGVSIGMSIVVSNGFTDLVVPVYFLIHEFENP